MSSIFTSSDEDDDWNSSSGKETKSSSPNNESGFVFNIPLEELEFARDLQIARDLQKMYQVVESTVTGPTSIQSFFNEPESDDDEEDVFIAQQKALEASDKLTEAVLQSEGYSGGGESKTLEEVTKMYVFEDAVLNNSQPIAALTKCLKTRLDYIDKRIKRAESRGIDNEIIRNFETTNRAYLTQQLRLSMEALAHKLEQRNSKIEKRKQERLSLRSSSATSSAVVESVIRKLKSKQGMGVYSLHAKTIFGIEMERLERLNRFEEEHRKEMMKKRSSKIVKRNQRK